MGQVGAEAGATVGKAPGLTASNGGLGPACRALKSGLLVGAIVVVNAVGNVVNPTTSEIVAGARHPKTGEFADIVVYLSDALPHVRTEVELPHAQMEAFQNTTIRCRGDKR